MVHLRRLNRIRHKLGALLAALSAKSACAHGIGGDGAGAFGEALGFDPLGLALMALLGIVYAIGQRRLARRAGAKSQRTRSATFFWSGWAALALAVGPPLESWTATSFAAHMIQHEIMMLVAAPLLVLARPLGVLLWGLPDACARPLAAFAQAPVVRAAGAWLCAPVAAWLIHAAVLWGWHVPVAFEASLASDATHWLQHATFLLAAVVFWWSVFASGGAGERRGAALLSLFTTAIHTTVLGTLLTISSRVWYPTYRDAVNPWGLSALEDQQLGGLIMWVPGGTVFVIAAVAVLALWLGEADRRSSPST